MSRRNRSEWAANADMRVALQTLPPAASVRSLHALKAKQAARRDRKLRALYWAAFVAGGVAMFCAAGTP